MRFLRSFLAVVVAVSLVSYAVPSAWAAPPFVGILTLANHAHVDEAAASPGLSVFEGERLSTEPGGLMTVRAGRSTLALGSSTQAALMPISGGMHIDLTVGTIYFSAAENDAVEVHAGEALLRPEKNQPTQAQITILSPKVLQITARHGGLNFSYREEYRNLPEGETYRIYLDAPAEPQGAAGAGAPNTQKTSTARKVTYFIVGAGAVGLGIWYIHEALTSGNPPISSDGSH